MQPTGQSKSRWRRFLTAALFAATAALSEALKIVAGFGQAPDASELWSLTAVTALSAGMGWIAAPVADLVAVKKNL